MHLLLNANAMVYYHIHILCIVQWQMHNVAKILIMFSIKFPGPVIFSEIFSLIFFPEVYCLCQPEKLWKKTIKDFLGFPKYDAKHWANEYLQQANSAVQIFVTCLVVVLVFDATPPTQVTQLVGPSKNPTFWSFTKI